MRNSPRNLKPYSEVLIMASRYMESKHPNASQSRFFNRRSFLKLSATSLALPPASILLTETANGATSQPASPPKGEPLPSVPKLADLASDRLVHHYRDLFTPPAAQNEWGYAHAWKSVSGITSITIPPFSCCGIPQINFSPGNLVTCELFLNDRILNSYPPPESRVAYTWYPHRVIRETRVQGLHFTTQTFMPSMQQAVAESIAVRNESQERRKVSLGFDLRAGVTMNREKPWSVDAVAEADNRLTASESRGCIVFESQHSRAVSVQGMSPRPDRIEHRRLLVYEFSLNPGETRTFHYLNIIGEEKDAVLESYDRLQAKFEYLLRENAEVFTNLIRSAFTPGNSEFSGHLPQLVTRDPALWKLYYIGFTNLLINRRLSPDLPSGAVYLTIPRFTRIYPFDAGLTSLSLSLLDPQALRRLLENWLVQDMHQHFATDYLTGEGVGPGYAANNFYILRCAHDYLRVTGDFGWLDKRLGGKTVFEYLLDSALYWKKLDKYGHGLADYGGLDNLLEVVSTWLHEVPALNAANVYGMRFVASLLERRGDSTRAAQLRSEARELAARINRLLYVEGKGWWKCGQPDGTFNEVRHCYDLLTLLDTMGNDLSEKQKKEMSHFFWSELYTPVWMHALSPGDVDASWNVRADHSWLGAYVAWPSMTAKGLYKVDPSAKVAAWVKGLAKTANQGPFGQAHIAETIYPPENGGAYKCPLELFDMYWAECAGGSYIDLIIESIFGADLNLYDGLQVKSRVADFDSEAKLLNVNYQGKSYTLTRQGSQRSG